MKLGELQRNFLAALTTGRTNPIREVIAETRDDRIAVYQASYAIRLRESLRDDFSELSATIGALAFDSVLQRFVREHPSQHPTLYGYSHQFMRWLAQERPQLAGLAEREWAALQVRKRIETEFASLDAAQISEKVDTLLIQRNQASQVAGRNDRAVLIWKKSGDVFEIPMSVETLYLYELLSAGPLGLSEFSERAAQGGITLDVFQATLAEWSAEGIVGIAE